jgi:nicotinamidase-related amidase
MSLEREVARVEEADHRTGNIASERLGDDDELPADGPGSVRNGEHIVQFSRNDTAVVFIDPQNDVLSKEGTAWAAVENSVQENKTIENMERIFRAAKQNGYEVFISPHYFYPTDSGWKFNGPLEATEFADKTFARRGALTLDGFPGSGADWLERFKPYIEDGRTVVVGPHKVWGPETNDLVLQLRKRRIGKVILGRMLANICVESTCSSTGSRSLSREMPPPAQGIPNGATDMPRRSSTSDFLHMRSFPRRKS